MELYLHETTSLHCEHRESPHCVIRICYCHTTGTKWQSQGELVENICYQERIALTLSSLGIYSEDCPSYTVYHLYAGRCPSYKVSRLYPKECPTYTVSQYIFKRGSIVHSISIYAKEYPSYTVSQHIQKSVQLTDYLNIFKRVSNLQSISIYQKRVSNLHSISIYSKEFPSYKISRLYPKECPSYTASHKFFSWET